MAAFLPLSSTILRRTKKKSRKKYKHSTKYKSRAFLFFWIIISLAFSHLFPISAKANEKRKKNTFMWNIFQWEYQKRIKKIWIRHRGATTIALILIDPTHDSRAGNFCFFSLSLFPFLNLLFLFSWCYVEFGIEIELIQVLGLDLNNKEKEETMLNNCYQNWADGRNFCSWVHLSTFRS